MIAFNPDASAVVLDDGLANRKAQTGAVRFALRGITELMKSLKDALTLGRLDAGAVVYYLNSGFGIDAGKSYLYFSCVLSAIFYRVRQ